MKRVWRFIGVLLTVLFIGYFAWFASHAIDFAVLRELLTIRVIVGLLVAAILYALIYPLTGWAWAQLLVGQGVVRSPAWLSAVVATSQLAKYVPGNVVQIAARATMCWRKGVPARPLAITLAQEAVLASIASLVVGLFMLVCSKEGGEHLPKAVKDAVPWLSAFAAAGVLLFASVRIAPHKFVENTNPFLRLIGGLGGLPGARVGIPVLCTYICNYLLIGLGLWAMAKTAQLPEALDYLAVTAAFSLSWILGFLAPGAPAGLGVREGIMILILGGVASDEALLAFVLLARLTTLLGDILAFAFGSMWLFRNDLEVA